MKNKLIAPLLAVAMLLSWGPGLATAATAKIATVSIQNVLDQAKVAVEARNQIETEFDKHRGALQRDQVELETLRDEIEKKSSVWSEQVRGQKERELQRRFREFEVRNEDAQLAVQQLEKSVMEPILTQLNEIIAEIGRKNGYDLILEYTMKGLRSRTGLLYAADTLDISKEVKEELDRRFE